ncbi:DUF4179 domain-containing protein [Paenibacillus cellulositrophicus]|uniref:DUF4179 domain-containing protein n=1 Tax=Paenibacillus cellulositrophicus TaxID=562959 RepID=UPI002040038E|nr:DUF4179 domain-containing protein [Paenibacillus cellulositrophicus]MCM2997182.1 DUF4179 domain-containing protein [Paenibacillus cellulositrophicus]
MPEKEQRILLQDAYEVNKHAETLPEMKLTLAMRKGMERGKMREKRRFYFWSTGTVMALAAALLIINYSIGSLAHRAEPAPKQTAGIPSQSALDPYRSTYLEGLASAMDRGLVKPIAESVEQKGYRVEVDGAVTDGRMAYVLFGVRNQTDKEVINADVSLELGGVEAPSKGASVELAGSNSNIISANGANHFIYTVPLNPSVQYTKDAKFHVTLTETSNEALMSSSNKYRTAFDISFELDPGMFKDKERVLRPDRTLTVDGQQVRVTQVIYTPLHTYVDLDYDQANGKRVFRLLSPVLIGKVGDEIEKLYYPKWYSRDNSEALTEGTDAMLMYGSGQKYAEYDSIRLKTEGTAAVDKDQLQIVIDLKKKQIVEAPDDRFTLISYTRTAGPGEVLIHRELENAYAGESLSLSLDDSFTDADGNVHKRQSPEGYSQGGHSWSNKKDTMGDDYDYNFGKDAVNYPQPLTIKVKQIWMPNRDTQAVELLK